MLMQYNVQGDAISKSQLLKIRTGFHFIHVFRDGPLHHDYKNVKSIERFLSQESLTTWHILDLYRDLLNSFAEKLNLVVT